MNILYILQQSVYDNNGKWVSADSNIQMMIGILREITKSVDWNFYILIGSLDKFSDIKSYDELIKHDQIKFIPYDFPVSAFINRQHFDSNEFESIITVLPKIDIVWNNITELTRNIKTWFHFNAKVRPKFITCCYWLDTIDAPKIDKNISYMWRQFDGFECSDLVVFTCKSTKKIFFENAGKIFTYPYIEKIKQKSTIWDFGFSATELNEYHTIKKFKIPTILFLNRMSGINYTHHEEFINAIKKLFYDYGQIENSFQVIFTNPSNKIDLKQLDIPNIKILKTPLNRKNYTELLWKADISVHLFKNEAYGGCAFRESVYCGNIPITPEVNEYKRILGKDWQYYCPSDIHPRGISDMLYSVLESKPQLTHGIHIRNSESSYEYNTQSVIEDIFSLK